MNIEQTERLACLFSAKKIRDDFRREKEQAENMKKIAEKNFDVEGVIFYTETMKWYDRLIEFIETEAEKGKTDADKISD